jgi:hypothetical protein
MNIPLIFPLKGSLVGEDDLKIYFHWILHAIRKELNSQTLIVMIQSPG